MKLCDIKERNGLEAFYTKESASDCHTKISALKKTIGVVAMRGDGVEEPEEILSGLEEIVLDGHWRALA